MSKHVKHVIADSGAFIRNVPLQNIGECIYTIPEVIKEIKDKATLQRLQVLPYKIEFRTPSLDSIQFVSNFAKKTGDYKSLSAVDIKVLALAYQLEKEHVGTEHIKAAPDRQVEWNTRGRIEKPSDIAGFYVANNKGQSRTTSTCDCETTSTEKNSTCMTCDSHVTNEKSCDTKVTTNESCETADNTVTEDSNVHQTEKEVPVLSKSDASVEKSNISDNSKHENTEDDASDALENYLNQQTIEVESGGSESESEEDEEEDDDDDDEGWITPSNIGEVQKRMGEMPAEENNIMVGCLTLDFAIQNVLIQMGLNVVSVEGYLIKRAKSYVLRCYACMKITTNVLKEFCPFCGNNTLQKVSMTVDKDGSIRYFLSKRKQMSTRGTKFSLPLPKGGKHANNPVLFEDQPLPQQRTTKKSKQKLDVFDPDYVAGCSPFIIKDITSRASQLGIKNARNGQFNKRNPNEVRKKYGRRK